MRIEIPPLHLTPPVTSGYLSDIVANQKLRQQELETWHLSIASQYEVAEGCRPANIFDALIGRITDPALVLMNRGRKVKLVRVEGVKQHKAEGWCVVTCEFNKRNKANISKYLKDAFPAQPTREEALKEYEAMQAKYHNSVLYNPVRFTWSR
jgi:hypothetical protein